MHQAQVALLGRPGAKLLPQYAQGCRIARHQQATAGIPVQAMHQFQGLARVELPQCVYNAPLDPAAAMYGQAAGLV